jgi:hypothetical protein
MDDVEWGGALSEEEEGGGGGGGGFVGSNENEGGVEEWRRCFTHV